MTGAATSVERFDSTVAPANAPTAPGAPTRRTTRQSTLPNLQWERPEASVVPISAGGPVAEAGEVGGGRGGGRFGADGQQQRRRRHAVGHAEAAVDELGPEAHQGEQDEGLHEAGTSCFRARGAAGTSGEAGSAARTGRGADTQEIDVDPPHEEHCRRRHGCYVYQSDRQCRATVPLGGTVLSRARSGQPSRVCVRK